MGNIKRQHSVSLKAKVALELLRGIESQSAICSRYSIHPTQARKWKAQFLAGMENLFGENGKNYEIREKDKLIEELYKQVGQLKVELDWLKKKSEEIR